jgi:sialic acid synthase SpsE
MATLKAAFPEHGIGFSDHSRGIDACLAAVALDALRIPMREVSFDEP